MSKQIFRQEALNYKNSTGLDGQLALPHAIPLKVLILILLFVLILLPIFFTFASYTDRKTVTGAILPEAGLFKLIAPIEGYVDAISVTEGQRVSTGDILLTIGNLLYDGQSARETNGLHIQAIKSPVSGDIATLNVYQKQNVRKYKPLLTIVPTGNVFEAVLLVSAADIGFIEVNNEVSLRYDAFPYQKYGQAKGLIKSISSTPFSALELVDIIGFEITSQTAGSFYIVKVILDKQTLDVGNVSKNLQTGMTLSADIKLENRKLYQWILDPLLSVEEGSN